MSILKSAAQPANEPVLLRRPVIGNVGPLRASSAVVTIKQGEDHMGLFGLFGKKNPQPDGLAWAEVAGKLAGTLWHLMQTDPKMLASPYARVVLRDDWNVGIAADPRDPNKLLGPNDISFVLLREDHAALEEWVNELRSNQGPMFQQIATEQYAKKLVRVLMSNVSVVD